MLANCQPRASSALPDPFGLLLSLLMAGQPEASYTSRQIPHGTLTSVTGDLIE